MASRVWQVLLELGILHSVDQRLVFEDSNTYYQFSFEECDAQGCEFRNEEEWQNGVRLLLQLVPYVQFRVVSPIFCSSLTELEVTQLGLGDTRRRAVRSRSASQSRASTPISQNLLASAFLITPHAAESVLNQK
ncbi:Rap guanine nucleotide exchange factor 5 [Anabarilius grahami]|uniref:Rap guanine nucleotide exchange factor 5 n=1 Tax=Anabarilius grahami TaxID=495550 RepID=A0A3N0XPF3_ANAGA|nr:Rap guanine nucleotide exchange factor 5 [Anabarilius grahami]